jgi:1,4-dihydroxy-2-naphthoyl-CoA synthase
MGAATAFAEMLSRTAPLSIKGAKALLNALSSGDGRLKEGDADCLIGAAISSDEYREGRTAFMEKRSPVFKGC